MSHTRWHEGVCDPSVRVPTCPCPRACVCGTPGPHVGHGCTLKSRVGRCWWVPWTRSVGYGPESRREGGVGRRDVQSTPIPGAVTLRSVSGLPPRHTGKVSGLPAPYLTPSLYQVRVPSVHGLGSYRTDPVGTRGWGVKCLSRHLSESWRVPRV